MALLLAVFRLVDRKIVRVRTYVDQKIQHYQSLIENTGFWPVFRPNLNQGAWMPGDMKTAESLDTWFVREILPLEPALMRFLRRNWRVDQDLADLRQEVYTRVYDA